MRLGIGLVIVWYWFGYWIGYALGYVSYCPELYMILCFGIYLGLGKGMVSV